MWKRLCASALVATAAFGPAAHAADPIKFGWLGSMTGPLSAPAIVFNKGIEYRVDVINQKGGINGRKVDLITRDTAGDPTKAVNFGQQIIFRDQVDAILGPIHSGEALATVPVIAKSGKLQLLTSSIDSITSVEKSPMAFRLFPTNTQFIEAATDYALDVLKAKKVAIFTDTTGYGTSTAKDAEKILEKRGYKSVMTVLLDPNKTDLSDDIAKAKAAGVDVIMPWTAANGLLARIMNGSRDIGWNVPIVGHPGLSAFAIKPLLHKPQYWDNVYAVSFANSARKPDGSVAPAVKELMDAVRPKFGGGKFEFTFWWFALGHDLARVSEEAIRVAGSTKPEAIRKAMEGFAKFPGAFATYEWGPKDRDGFPQAEITMVKASTFDDGLFQPAPR